MWNAVLTAHTQPGDVEAVARLFHSMAELELGFELIELNGLKFLALLTACSNAGAAAAGLSFGWKKCNSTASLTLSITPVWWVRWREWDVWRMWRTLHAQHHVSQMQQCGFTRLAGCVVHHIFFREHAKTKNLARHSMKKASLQPKDHPGSETGMPATTERLKDSWGNWFITCLTWQESWDNGCCQSWIEAGLRQDVRGQVEKLGYKEVDKGLHRSCIIWGCTIREDVEDSEELEDLCSLSSIL
uniref:Pentatricopeptide repeat-containing protein n=1 Tax=Oryza barthii TaxID=65489 RepID=A0A0D3FDM1_9ORYZ